MSATVVGVSPSYDLAVTNGGRVDVKKNQGSPALPGQRRRQFERWTGKAAPRELMRRVVLEELKKRSAV